ncbi:unnamed protein product [Ectocarpus sp. 12 AP-2014]
MAPDVAAFYNCVLDVFTESDASHFASPEHDRLAAVLLMAEKWIPVLLSFLGSSFNVKKIIRKTLKKDLGRIEKEFPALSRTTKLVQGCDKKTGDQRSCQPRAFSHRSPSRPCRSTLIQK